MEGRTWKGLLIGLLVLAALFPAASAGRPTKNPAYYDLSIAGPDITTLENVRFNASSANWAEDDIEAAGGTWSAIITGGVYTFGDQIKDWYNETSVRAWFGHIRHYYRTGTVQEDSWWLYLDWDYDVNGDGVIQNDGTTREYLMLSGETSIDPAKEGVYDSFTKTWTIQFDRSRYVLEAITEVCTTTGRRTKCTYTSNVVWEGCLTFSCVAAQIG